MFRLMYSDKGTYLCINIKFNIFQNALGHTITVYNIYKIYFTWLDPKLPESCWTHTICKHARGVLQVIISGWCIVVVCGEVEARKQDRVRPFPERRQCVLECDCAILAICTIFQKHKCIVSINCAKLIVRQTCFMYF